MAVPSSKDARLFYRAANLRYEEAEVLYQAEYNTGAVYLAGYGIECILKALIITANAPVKRSETLASFRGNKAHDFRWLIEQYLDGGGPRLPNDIMRLLVLVDEWSTDLRYSPAHIDDDETKVFLSAADEIIIWADGRL